MLDFESEVVFTNKLLTNFLSSNPTNRNFLTRVLPGLTPMTHVTRFAPLTSAFLCLQNFLITKSDYLAFSFLKGDLS